LAHICLWRHGAWWIQRGGRGGVKTDNGGGVFPPAHHIFIPTVYYTSTGLLLYSTILIIILLLVPYYYYYCPNTTLLLLQPYYYHHHHHRRTPSFTIILYSALCSSTHTARSRERAPAYWFSPGRYQLLLFSFRSPSRPSRTHSPHSRSLRAILFFFFLLLLVCVMLCRGLTLSVALRLHPINWYCIAKACMWQRWWLKGENVFAFVRSVRASVTRHATSAALVPRVFCTHIAGGITHGL